MRPFRYLELVRKSRAACVAAIETYNRVAAPYREESFAILMINAWELLLKARIVSENNGQMNSIYEYERTKKKDGSTSKVRRVKTSRTGAPLTIGLERSYNLVSGYIMNRVDAACIANIEALLTIRDSATHFVVSDPLLNIALAEVALAAVRNYVVAAQRWFGVSFSDLNIASIPLSFHLDQDEVEALAKKRPAAIAKFLTYLFNAETASARAGSTHFTFRVKVEFDLVKKKSEGAVQASVVQSNPDLTLTVDVDTVPPGFDWDYDELTQNLKKRYKDFKQNEKYHKARRPLEKNRKLCFERKLDPKKIGGVSKRFYNPNIVKEFDPMYLLRDSGG